MGRSSPQYDMSLHKRENFVLQGSPLTVDEKHDRLNTIRFAPQHDLGDSPDFDLVKLLERIILQTIKAPQASMIHIQGCSGCRPARAFTGTPLRNVFNFLYYMQKVVV